jgi:uncharacterized protein
MTKDNTLNIITHVLGLFSGFIGALIIFLVTKEKDVKEHAKKALNWQISLLIYSFISGILIFVLIGFLLIPILGILNIIFCIMAAIKANKGELWNYPLTIQFLK